MTAKRKRMPRRAMSATDKIEKRSTVEASKAITSTDLGNAGKLAPASLGSSGIKVKEEKPKRKTATEKFWSDVIDVSKCSATELVELHAELHREFMTKADREGSMNLHALIVDELADRNVAHPSPPGDMLDDVSTEFEVTKAERPTLQPIDATKAVVNSVEVEKGETLDPFVDVPTEDEKHPFTVHQRWIGKALRSEFRARAGDVAVGWELDTQIAPVTAPVETLKQARALPVEAVSAIDFRSGEWKREVVCKRKAPAPVAWLDIEARTKAGIFDDEGGVLQIVEKGVVEFGAQFDGFHEYFPQGTGLNYPILFKRDGDDWKASHSDDFTPFVLTEEAVEKGWLPPAGVSALPVEVRKQIPEGSRYWEKTDDGEAKTIRDGLVQAITKGDVEIDFALPFKREIRKASMNHSRFAIHKAVAGGEESTLLRLDIGHDELVSVEMGTDADPESVCEVVFKSEPHREALDFEGVVSGGHFLNPTKGVECKITKLDAGSARVLKLEDSEMKVELDGAEVKGVFVLKEVGEGAWTWSPDEAEQIEKVFVPILKAEKRQVTGVVLEPGTVDAQKDTVDEAVIEKAAHNFLARYRESTKLGLMHTIFGQIGVTLVESYVSEVAMKLGGKKVKKGSWIMKVKIENDQLWKKIKAGKITGFSIGGIATVAS